MGKDGGDEAEQPKSALSLILFSKLPQQSASSRGKENTAKPVSTTGFAESSSPITSTPRHLLYEGACFSQGRLTGPRIASCEKENQVKTTSLAALRKLLARSLNVSGISLALGPFLAKSTLGSREVRPGASRVYTHQSSFFFCCQECVLTVYRGRPRSRFLVHGVDLSPYLLRSQDTWVPDLPLTC